MTVYRIHPHPLPGYDYVGTFSDRFSNGWANGPLTRFLLAAERHLPPNRYRTWNRVAADSVPIFSCPAFGTFPFYTGGYQAYAVLGAAFVRAYYAKANLTAAYWRRVFPEALG